MFVKNKVKYIRKDERIIIDKLRRGFYIKIYKNNSQILKI